MSILTNHLGYLPEAAKFCLLGGGAETDFVVRDQSSGKEDLRGRLRRAAADLGSYSVGDFSRLRRPGAYVIEIERERSYTFKISPDVYANMLQQMVGYFGLQRCGDTNKGWHGRCHTDDGIRSDNREHRDVEGGWHDACDLRKWVSATLYGMLGLARLKSVLDPKWDHGRIEEELQWGNRYFLKMQEPDGYVMNHCGGDAYVHADNNRWTDNSADGKDDRVIDVRPCDTIAQWVFVLSQAAVSRLAKGRDAKYAGQCLDAARKCAEWLWTKERTQNAGELGAGVAALTEMHRATGEAAAMERAVALADRLLALQVVRQEDSRSPVWGFFWNGRDESQSLRAMEPYRHIRNGAWPLLGLCEILERDPKHARADAWRTGIRLYCENYLEAMAGRNAFGMVPYGLYREPHGGGRRAGSFEYRWFMESDGRWYVGINANLAAAGAGLARAGRLLGNGRWTALAQRQLDWILGVNPYNACTVMGAGHNNPQQMFGTEYDPPTPFLPGAVLNGISGDADDRPQLRPGDWHECEYWTPMAGYTLWLLAELSAMGVTREARAEAVRRG